MANEGSPTPTRSVRCDWMRAVCERVHADKLIGWLTDRFDKPETSGGRAPFKASQTFNGDGATFVAYGGSHVVNSDGNELCMVQISGSTLEMMDDADQLDFIRFIINLGGRFTRFDVAVDFLDGSGSDLICNLETAFERGQVCGPRIFQHVVSMLPHGEVTGDTLYFGKRGKDGSGKFIRVYDKGLQTRTGQDSQWVRFELEATHGVAEQVSVMWLEADDAKRQLLALDAIEVRKVTGDAHRSKRPMLPWWESIRGGSEVERVTRTRKGATTISYVQWLKTSVMPAISTLSEKTGLTLEQVMFITVGELDEKPDSKVKVHVRQLVHMLKNPDELESWNPDPVADGWRDQL